MELGHFDKLFVKNTRKKDPAGKNFGAFPPRYSYNYILNGRFKLMDTIKGTLMQI